MMIDDYAIEVLMRDLVGHDRQPSSFLIYVWLTFEAGRTRRDRVQVSYQTIADCVGISKSAAQIGIQWLLRRKLLDAKKRTPTAVPSYRVLRPWQTE
jgi:hypothetical protein